MQRYKNQNYHYIPRENYKELKFTNGNDEFFILVGLRVLEGDESLLDDPSIEMCLDTAVSQIPWLALDNRSEGGTLGSLHRVNLLPVCYRVDKNIISFYPIEDDKPNLNNSLLVLEVMYFCNGDDVTNELLDLII